MKRRAILILLAAVLLAAVCSAGPDRASGLSFSDLGPEDERYPYVVELIRAGLLEGGAGEPFGPEEPVGWEEAAALLLRALGAEGSGSTGELAVEHRSLYTFEGSWPEGNPTRREAAGMAARGLDLLPFAGESPYADCGDGYVVKLFEKGLLEESGSTGELAVEHRLLYTFEGSWPEGNPTRREAAGMAARGLDLLPFAGESPYADCGDGYVVKLFEKGLLEESGEFRPDDPVTRGELAMLVWRMLRADVSAGAFRYNNYWVEPLEGVPAFGYDAGAFRWEEDRPSYAGDRKTALGVDVSGYQGDVDWAAVKADGVDFAIIRVGGRFLNSGKLYDDSYFERNVEGALAAGLEVGVYFFSQAICEEEGLEEAEYVLERIRDYDVTMPVVIDWEYLGGSEARTYGVEPEAVTAGVEAFCRRVAEAGLRPMVYFNSYCGYIKMDLRRLADYGFWFAQYAQAPSFAYHFDLWQYTNTGRVDGIAGEVDMNLYFLPE